MSSDERESYTENRRRRIAYFRNNWGTNLQQIDEEDLNEDVLKSPKTGLRTRRSSEGQLSPDSRSSTLHGNGLIHLISRHEWLKTAYTHNIPTNSWCQRSTKAHSNTYPHSNDSFCNCRHELNVQCNCGEYEDAACDWRWDTSLVSKGVQFSEDNKDVVFHNYYSCGTACVRGSKPFKSGQHFWEVKLISPVYGTDMMVGVGTEDNDLNRNETKFCSMLGENGESWGLSYTGSFYHNGEVGCYSPRFTQGSIIGIHVDTWHGQLSFFRNRQPLGVASNKDLKGKTLYPMLCSTAAKTAMRLVQTVHFETSLQYFCCVQLRSIIPSQHHVLDVVKVPPGLDAFLRSKLDWLLMASVPTTTTGKRDLTEENACENINPKRIK